LLIDPAAQALETHDMTIDSATHERSSDPPIERLELHAWMLRAAA